MTATVALVLVALWATLLTWAIATLANDSKARRSRGGRRSTVDPQTQRSEYPPPRPNPLCWFAGALGIGAGLLAVIDGVRQMAAAMDHPDPFGVKGAEAIADAESAITWGVVILTVGLYVWRGARRRGWQDRLGRVIIVAGYLLLGVALSQMLHTAVDLWAADSPGEGEEVLVETMVRFVGWGAPASLLVYVGTRLAHEKILLTAHANASF